ncbi:hypothetical protein ACFQPF_05840 [Fictibacillus iocasae]|uniref:Uncharacterized protein n=1 Tax=Fictibacillus iocasae TaxID=2715437 RepID=A0ABW2NR66_9BACL
MKVLQITGVELVKEKPNTSEDFFNRSTVIYTEGGREIAFELLYVRFFEEQFAQQAGWNKDAVLTVENQAYSMKEIAALAAILSDESLRKKRKAYINDFVMFSSFFQDENVIEVKNRLASAEKLVKNH